MKSSKIKRNIILAIIICLVCILGFLTIDVIGTGSDIYNENANLATNERTSDTVLTNWLTQDKHFDIDAFKKKYRVEEISIKSSVDGHTIPASYIYAEEKNDKSANTVIMVHGLLGNRLSNYPMAQLFLSQGYNVITYDQRNSGGNTAKHTTFGYLESNDTLDYINYAKSNMASGSKLGVWGQSMGGATVQNAMDDKIFKDNVNFVILDCPLGNMEDMIGADNLLEKLERKYASHLSKKNLGFSYDQQRVYPQIENTKIPVMVASSEGDERIPYQLQKKIYDTIKNKDKKLYTVKDSKHSDIYFDHADEYQSQVNDFLKTYVK